MPSSVIDLRLADWEQCFGDHESRDTSRPEPRPSEECLARPMCPPPLGGAHGRRARVGDEVEGDGLGLDEEQVVARLAHDALALLAVEEGQGFDLLDLEGLDDGPWT